MRTAKVIFLRGLLLGAVSLVVGSLYINTVSSSLRELLPKGRWMTDPNYYPTLTLGSLVFKIPNRFLAYPWKSGAEPASTLCAGSTNYRRENEGLCSTLAVEGSLSLELPLTLTDKDGRKAHWLSAVTVLFGDTVSYPPHLLASYNDWRRGQLPTLRVPQSDLADFDAFEIIPHSYVVRHRMFSSFDQVHDLMVRTNEAEPRFADCMRSDPSQSISHATCVASMGFLIDQFPQKENMRYPYLVKYNLPGWALIQSHYTGMMLRLVPIHFIVRSG